MEASEIKRKIKELDEMEYKLLKTSSWEFEQKRRERYAQAKEDLYKSICVYLGERCTPDLFRGIVKTCGEDGLRRIVLYATEILH